MAELHLVSGEVAVKVERQLDYNMSVTVIHAYERAPTFQELVPLTPVNYGVENEHRARVEFSRGCVFG